ncbi:triose-phosphate transporter [Ophiocordyceps camponoti-floridani]|uniref:Triose-phosphate transporter n=1 Tax=Ophiocordyceps camponoti-floridani TaxID=2030778 RepID=A0A8H4Q465_9HYPO|nr:triose-phosphate transporter [Ophiocordyceps camponoti-floridani]
MAPTSSSSSSADASPVVSQSSTEVFDMGYDEQAIDKGPEPSPSKGLHPALYIANWIFFSNLTILFNKWILDSAGFRYPILLTCWHLVFSVFATQILARTTTLLDSRHKLPMTPRLYLRTICPIGLFYSGSLVCSNLVYLYLSVAFIQMLKSAAPVAVLFASWAWRVADPSLDALVNVLVIVAGVALASFGEIQFSLIGFLYQLGGIVFEAVRIVMIQVMLSGQGLNMDPIVGLYYYAPVCAGMNILVALFTEIPRFKWEDAASVGFFMLLLNALIAFMLNIASVFLIGKTSGLVMTLSGILKNILLIVVSVIIWRTEITPLQGVGYTIALAGLTYYSVGYDQLAKCSQGAVAWMAASMPPSTSTLQARRLVLTAIFALTGLLVLLVGLQRFDGRTGYSPRVDVGTE